MAGSIGHGASYVRMQLGRRLPTLADHAAGNYRVLMNLADELLMTAADRELPRLDEKLYLEAFGQPAPKKVAAGKKR
jgi:hypothetical protein